MTEDVERYIRTAMAYAMRRGVTRDVLHRLADEVGIAPEPVLPDDYTLVKKPELLGLGVPNSRT